MSIIKFKQNALEELYDDAIHHNRYFFLISVAKDTDASYWLEHIVNKELFLSYVTVSFKDTMFMLATRTCPDLDLNEYTQKYNEQLAVSFSTAFGHPVIFGKGKENAFIYSNISNKTTSLEYNDIYSFLNILGKEINFKEEDINDENIEILNKHEVKEADYNTLFAYCRKIHYYYPDCISTEIYTLSIVERKSSKWLNKLKRKIENKNALKHIKKFNARLKGFEDLPDYYARTMREKNFCNLSLI